jgi:hypothetical protein
MCDEQQLCVVDLSLKGTSRLTAPGNPKIRKVTTLKPVELRIFQAFCLRQFEESG